MAENDSAETPVSSPGFGQRGEALVALQVVLIGIFVLTPVWPELPRQVMAETAWIRLPIVVLLMLAAMAFGGLGSVHIRKYLTPLPYPVDHSQLVSHGVYALVRHPLYASLLFMGLAYCIYQWSAAHFLLVVVGFYFFDYKATKEEAWLTERHPEYPKYASGVSKFIPWVY